MTPVSVFFSAQIPIADFQRPLCQQLHREIYSGISLFLLSLDYVCPEISNHSKNKCNAEVLHKHIQYKNLHHSLLPNTSTNEAQATSWLPAPFRQDWIGCGLAADGTKVTINYLYSSIFTPLHQHLAGIRLKYWYQTFDQSPSQEHGNGQNHRDDRPHPCAFDSMSSQHWRGLRRGLAYNRT
jgi:hypothetical protein